MVEEEEELGVIRYGFFILYGDLEAIRGGLIDDAYDWHLGTRSMDDLGWRQR